MSEILILTTTDSSDLARAIAGALVEAGEAACVNVVSGVRSIYRWEGATCDEQEYLLLIKSSAERFEAVRTRIRQMHTYKLPEVIALPVSAGDPDYLRWLSEQVATGTSTEPRP
jgi:periplasmic divalent cation tolerance protein